MTGRAKRPDRYVAVRLYDATGAPRTSELTLARKDDVTMPAIDMPTRGAFVATWTRDPNGRRSAIEGFSWRGQTPVAAMSLRIKDPADPKRRVLVVKLKDPLVRTLPGLGADPIAHGATVHVFNTRGTGDTACFTLPAGAWATRPTRGGPSYAYRDAVTMYGPCKNARVQPGELALSCLARQQPIPFSLDEASQGNIAVIVTTGEVSYCAELGGIRRDETGVFVASQASAPAVCPTPPAGCP